MLLSAENISINYGLRQLLDGVTLHIDRGDKAGIIGINGTGKSTFLKILAGEETPDEGTVTRDPNVQISFLSQNPVMDADNTILEQIFASFPEDFRLVNEYEAKTMLTKLGLADFEAKIGTLSGGQKKRVALVAALIHPADVLILDEPTNHLDTEMTAWLEDWLRSFSGGIVMITHDRYFLERVANRIVELDKAKIYFYEANYSRYLELKTQRMEIAEASERKRLSILRVEKEWIMRGAQARRTKNKDRIERYEALKAQNGPEYDEKVQINAISSRLGRKTIELENVSHAYGSKTVISNFSYGVLRDARIGIIGSNGAGKSTLLKIMAGKLTPSGGSVDFGATVKVGYFSQESEELPLERRVFDYIHEIAREVKTDAGTFSAKEMMERFLFPSELQGQFIGKLSGGERRRLQLLGILMQSPNILMFDEPTNDLDITTLAILEDYLDSFDGAVIAVSHDRYFLDRVAAEIFEVCGDGRVERYSGNYSDYLAKRPEEEKQQKEKITPKERKTDENAVKKYKFSFKEQREFETIDDDIAELEQQIEDCEKREAEFASNYVKLQEIYDEKEKLSALLDEKMERWVYLNDLNEKIEAQRQK